MITVRPSVVITSLVLLLAGGAGVGLLLGHGSLDSPAAGTLLTLRGWRIVAAALAGAALAVGGVLMQGLFRNPLASPDVLGTTAGATLGGQCALVGHAALLTWFGAALPAELLLPLGCLTGALCALLALVAVGERAAGLVALLIVGFLLSAFCGSLSTLLTSLARGDWELARALQGFGLGGVDGKGAAHAALAAPLVIIGIAAAWCWSRPLDLLLSGEEEAAALGVDVAAVRRWALVWTAVLSSAAVAVGGGAVFVGLIVPHVLRRLLGAEHRTLVPAAALGGAAFLVWCDDLARSLTLGGEVPLTVVTGLLGAPLFAVLFLRAQRQGLS